MKLNLGCGEKKLPGFINIDCEESQKPDLLHDFTKEPLPYEEGSVDEIFCIHNLEHIPLHAWSKIFYEFKRLLKVGGILVLAYPEFDVCVKYYQENHQGLRVFWRACLYGRQLWPGDFHVTPIHSPELAEILRKFGFENVNWAPDDSADYYSFMKAVKGHQDTKEDVLRKEIFEMTL